MAAPASKREVQRQASHIKSSDHEFARTIPYDRPRSAGGRARRLANACRQQSSAAAAGTFRIPGMTNWAQ